MSSWLVGCGICFIKYLMWCLFLSLFSAFLNCCMFLGLVFMSSIMYVPLGFSFWMLFFRKFMLVSSVCCPSSTIMSKVFVFRLGWFHISCMVFASFWST